MGALQESMIVRITALIKHLWNSATQRVMSITTFGMAAALLVDVLLASRLGTSMTTDALIIALTLPQWIEVVVREGTKFSLVPLFIEMRIKLSKIEYQNFVNSLLNSVLLIGFIFTLVFWIFAPQITTILAPGLSSDGKLHAALLFRITAPMTIFALGSTVLGILLNSHHHFAIVATRNGVAPTIVVIILVLNWNSPNISIWVAGAYTLGYALFFILLFGYSIFRVGIQQNFLVWPDKKILNAIMEPIAYPTLGYGARQGVRLVERMIASIISVGGISTYYFSMRIFSGIQTLIGISYATTATPSMTEFVLENNRVRLTRFIKKRLLQIVALSIPITTILMVFSRPIIKLVYGRGEFTDTSVLISSRILFWLAAGLVFACIVPLLISSIYALKNIKEAFYIILIVSVARVILAIPLSMVFGLPGLAIAATLTSIFSIYQIVLYLKKEGILILGKQRI